MGKAEDLAKKLGISVEEVEEGLEQAKHVHSVAHYIFRPAMFRFVGTVVTEIGKQGDANETQGLFDDIMTLLENRKSGVGFVAIVMALAQVMLQMPKGLKAVLEVQAQMEDAMMRSMKEDDCADCGACEEEREVH